VKDDLYPVSVYDHDEALSDRRIAYHGRIPALKGKFVLATSITARVASDLAAMKKATTAFPRRRAGRRKSSSMCAMQAQTCGRIVSRSDREEDG